jgi:hypothetical protein
VQSRELAGAGATPILTPRRRPPPAVEPGDAAEALSFDDLPDTVLHCILDVHREACFDCTGVSHRFRRVCLEAVGALEAEPWAVRLATERGHVAALRALLDGGADIKVDMKDESAVPPRPAGTTPLHCAALNGPAEAVRLLLAAGSAVDARTAHRDTPLHLPLSTATPRPCGCCWTRALPSTPKLTLSRRR